MATTTYSPIVESEQEAGGHDYDEAATATGCGCFRRFCFGWEEGGSNNYLLRETGGGVLHNESWASAKFKKLKEFSEMVAGPKWKNFIRKIGKICNPKKYNNKSSTTQQFQYSPMSYAMNFDGDQHEEDGNLLHSFSSRFAPHHGSVNDQQQTRLAL